LFCAGYATAKPFDFKFEKKANKIISPLGDYRVLVLCLPNKGNALSEKANDLYAKIDWMGFDERDLVFVEMTKTADHTVKKYEYENTDITTRSRIVYGVNDYKISSIAQCNENFEFVLIGKDRTQKKRWKSFPEFDDIYSTIDAMPMRRYEMRERASKN